MCPQEECLLLCKLWQWPLIPSHCQVEVAPQNVERSEDLYDVMV